MAYTTYLDMIMDTTPSPDLACPPGKIEYWLTEHDDGYYIGDWFFGDAMERAQAAATVEEADAILRAGYKGPDCEGVCVHWYVPAA